MHLIENHNFDVNADDKCNNHRWFYGLGGSGRGESGSPLRFAMIYHNLVAFETLLLYSAHIKEVLSMDMSNEEFPGLKALLESGKFGGKEGQK